MNNKILEARDITVCYGDKKVLDGFNMSIYKGEFVGILGPNGTGKSTLIKAITDLVDISSGEIFIEDINNKKLSKRERAKRIAVVPQEFSIDFDFTTFDIVMMGRNPHVDRRNKSDNNDYEIVKEAMKLTNTWEFRDRYFNQLSGGERQRVIVARAIAQQTNIILLDEPTSHLDIHHQLEIMELIHMLKTKRNITVVAVLHDVNMAARFSDRIILLNEGQVLVEGSPDEVVSEKYLSKLYHMEMIIRENKVIRKKEIIPLRVIKDKTIQKTKKVHIISGGGSGEEIIEKLNSAGISVTTGVLNQGDSDWELCKILNIPCVEALPFSGITKGNMLDNSKFIEEAEEILVTNVPFGSGNLKNLEVLLEVDKPIYFYRKGEDIDYTEGKAIEIIKELEQKPNFKYIHDYDEFINSVE